VYSYVCVDGIVHAVAGHVVVSAAVVEVGFDVAFMETFGEPGVDFGGVTGLARQ
jgi:hypothetical protein